MNTERNKKIKQESLDQQKRTSTKRHVKVTYLGRAYLDGDELVSSDVMREVLEQSRELKTIIEEQSR